MEKQGGRTVETVVEARGAVLGRPVLLVLVAGLALVVVAFLAVFLGYFPR